MTNRERHCDTKDLLRRIVAGVLLAGVLSMLCFSGAFAQATQPAPNGNGANPQDELNLVEAARMMRESGRVQFNFKDLELVKFLRFMSELLEENIVVDPNLKGNVTLLSQRPVSLKEARQVMISVLEMYGLSLVPQPGYTRVASSQKAGATADPVVRKGRVGPGLGEQSVTQVVPLDYVSAGFVLKAIQPNIPTVTVTPLDSGTGIVLVGRATDVQKAIGIIHALDVADSSRITRVISLGHIPPSTLVNYLNTLSQQANSALFGVVAVADDARKTLVVVHDPKGAKELDDLVARLDVPSVEGEFHVYQLRNAGAKDVAEKLSQLLAMAAGMQADQQGKLPTVAVADEPNNTVIFAASSQRYESIVKILDQLDRRPKQVLIRGLVAEVNMTKLDNAGVDWATWGGSVTGDAILGGQLSMGETAIPDTFLEWFQNLTKVESIYTDSSGNDHVITSYEGKGLVFAYVNLLKKFDAINVLSMPRVLCTDSVPASLQVGQVIPQLKSKTSDTSNPSAVQNSYEYKDTGLILKVTPRVRSNNLVVLEIEQIVEDVLTSMASERPVTTKREIKTSITVEDGQTVILGGLMKEAEKSLRQRVPGLSYIPLVGNLFQRTVKQKEKVDLMVFLTPYIVEEPGELSTITREVAESGDLQLSPHEDAVQKRFEQLYREAVKKQ
ncbi:type II secretion system secretin GspD [Aminiphilus circumscriptus]|jgi:general secretion pathway protein D|uniref:type II secretion system secretin GspD n=1 Tax=Aminiphilus circumscriptus TaxID=290732 RepID=UPI000492BE52|nr:type II secretion system secretin GspD [Aminiphilus circumscriptus]